MKGKKTALIFCLILALNVPLVFGAWIVKDIQDPESDQFQFESGVAWDGVDTLVLKDPSSQVKVALRFRGLNVDRNTRINGANLSFYSITSAYPFQANSSITIYGFAVDDLRPFDIVEPWNLPITSAHTIWNTSNVIDSIRYNVSVGNIVQEIVSRYGYTSASKMGFMLYSVTGEQRVVYASEFGHNRGPILYIEHSLTPPPPPGLPPGAEYNSTVDGYDIYRIPGYSQVTSVVTAQQWDTSGEVYPYQEKTAYSNYTDRFYIFGTRNTPGDSKDITYLTKPRVSDTWTENYSLWSRISDPASGLYSDYHLWKDGKTLDIAWINTYPVNNYVYYQRFELQMDGTMNNVSDTQKIYESAVNKAVPPITIMLDSEGYPYVAVSTFQAPNIYNAQLCWSNLNNGTFNHTATSPLSASLASGEAPTTKGPWVVELYRGGNRRVFMVYLGPQFANDINNMGSARIINSGSWIAEGAPNIDELNRRKVRWSISGSSICDDADPYNSTFVVPDFGQRELYERPVNIPVRVNETWDSTFMQVMGATVNDLYYTVGSANNTKSTRFKIKSGDWSSIIPLRTFEDAVSDITTWQFCAQQYPTFDGNKTIVSYAWRDGGKIAFWHDWFYLSDGPDPNSTDPYYQAWENGSLVFECETLDCLTDIIEDFDPDPDDPEPGFWSNIGGLDRFRTKMIIFVLGLIMLMGSLLFGLAMKPSASTWIGIFFSMLVGWALLIATQTM